MKKFAIIGIVLILLASSVMPVMAGNGHGNGNGNGNEGQGAQNQEKNQNKVKTQDQEKHANQGLGRFKNAENNKWMTTPFYIQGVVTAVGADSITVSVTHANAKAKSFIGTDFVIKVTTDTQIFQVTQGEANNGTEDSKTPEANSTGDENNENDNAARAAISLSQVTVGESVAIHGRLFTPDYIARMITVYLGGKLGQPIDSKTTTP